jgi:hypothetical protein
MSRLGLPPLGPTESSRVETAPPMLHGIVEDEHEPGSPPKMIARRVVLQAEQLSPTAVTHRSLLGHAQQQQTIAWRGSGTGLSCHKVSREVTAWNDLTFTLHTSAASAMILYGAIDDHDKEALPAEAMALTGAGNSVIDRDCRAAEQYLYTQWCDRDDPSDSDAGDPSDDLSRPWRSVRFLARFPKQLSIPFDLVGAWTANGELIMRKINYPHGASQLLYSGRMLSMSGAGQSVATADELRIELDCPHAAAILQVFHSPKSAPTYLKLPSPSQLPRSLPLDSHEILLELDDLLTSQMGGHSAQATSDDEASSACSSRTASGNTWKLQRSTSSGDRRG